MDKFKLVDELFETWDKDNSPGVAISVAVNDEVIFKKGYGYANLEYDIPITPSTIFNLASVSKQFTAFSILLLEQEGKLSLNDDVHKYIPELPDFGTEIRIEHLIHHTSGLRDHWELMAISGWGLDDVMTQERLEKITMKQEALNFEPGTKYSYSNPGYLLMGEIIKRVSGLPFPEFMEKNIFKPLKMGNTYSHDEYGLIVKNRAYSYKKDNKHGFKTMPCNTSVVGPGNLLSTVEDLAKWGNNFFTFEHGGKDLIEKMLTRFTLKNGEVIPYACGVNIEEYKGIKTIQHGGTIAGFKSNLLCLPEHNMTITLLSNLSSFDPAFYCYKLAELFLSKEYFKEDDKYNLYENLKNKSSGKKSENTMDFQGKYITDTKSVVKVEVEDEQLYITLSGTNRNKILYISERLYINEDTDALVKFKKEDGKNVYGLEFIYPSNNKLFAKKTKTISMSEEDLNLYVGRYHSQEVDTYYDIIKKDGALIARHTWKEDTGLVFSSEDTFVAEVESDKVYLEGEVKFVRNQGHQILGFKLSGNRAFNIWFCKI